MAGGDGGQSGRGEQEGEGIGFRGLIRAKLSSQGGLLGEVMDRIEEESRKVIGAEGGKGGSAEVSKKREQEGEVDGE